VQLEVASGISSATALHFNKFVVDLASQLGSYSSFSSLEELD
jgi:hypothetical protein